MRKSSEARVASGTGTADPLLDWLYSLRGPSLKWDIETARAFSRWLGHPWRAFDSVHIAGTNGKGSVAAFVQSIGRAAGLSTGLFTSPHLIRPEERIRLDDDDIDSTSFREWIGLLKKEATEALEQGVLERHPSFFEMLTFASMLAFRKHDVGLAVIETGLGGRLDATNVIVPRLTVITTISKDHTRTLGSTLERIAAEKAGIIKPGIPVLVGWIEDGPRRVIKSVALERGAPFYDAAVDCDITPGPEGIFSLKTPEQRYGHLACGLRGRHQRRNAALAVRATELLRQHGIPIRSESVGRGLSTVRWPGRIECFAGRPSVLLDAAHNDESAAALGRFLGERPPVSGDGLRVLVMGTTGGRDAARIMAPILPHVDRVVLTRPEISKAVDPARAKCAVEAGGTEATVVEDLEQAIDKAKMTAGLGGEVIIAGSIYLVGDARRLLLGETGPGHPRREVVPPVDTDQRDVSRPHAP